MDCIVGKNAVRLILSDEYSRLHPVFNVSLIMPYFTESMSLPEKLITADISDAQSFKFITDWVAIELIVDHRVQDSSHEYLLRATINSGTEDDFWVPLDNISKDLDPFIQRFHEIHWDHSRPSWLNFFSASRPDRGLVAKPNRI